MKYQHPLVYMETPKKIAGAVSIESTVSLDLGKIKPVTINRVKQSLESGLCKFSMQSITGLIYDAVAKEVGIPAAFMTTQGGSGWHKGVTLVVYDCNPQLHEQLMLYNALVSEVDMNAWRRRQFEEQRASKTLTWWSCEIPYENVLQAMQTLRPVSEKLTEKALQLVDSKATLKITLTNEDFENAQ